jgi:RHS repeat-associated protein
VVVVGDPVDVVTGANLDGQTDFTLAGPLPLAWSRWYNSRNNWTPGGFGWGHTHDYERRLVRDVDGIRYLGPTGGVVAFPSLEHDGDEFANSGYLLRRVSRNSYTLSQTGRPRAVFEFAEGHSFAHLTALLRGSARVEFRYDRDDFLHTIIDSKGRPVRVEHDSAGRISRLSLPGPGGKTKQLAAYQYDAIGNLVRATDPYNNSLRYQFDEEHRQIRRTDRRGYSFRFAYDAAGRCILAGGEDRTDEVKLEYDPVQRVTLVTRADGGQWLYLHDASGVVSRIIAPTGATQQFVKDEAGRVSAEIDPLGNITRRVYDTTGGLVGRTDPLGAFWANGEEPSSSPPHRVPQNPAEWDLGDILLPTVSPPVHFDPILTRVNAAAAQFIQTLPAGQSQKSVREADELGMVFRETFPDGTVRRWNYDANGKVVKYTDREGSVRSFAYASWNMQITGTNQLGGHVRYRYSLGRHITAVIDPGGTQSEFAYDLENRMTSVRRHGVVKETYQYDLAGNLTGKRGAKGEPLLVFEYGPRNLMTIRRLASGETHTFTYDEHGRYLLAKTDSLVVAFKYDAAGRQIRDERDGEGVVHKFVSRRLKETSVLGTFRTGYRWKPGEVSITDPTGGEHTIRLLGKGLVERSLANGSVELTQYGSGGRCLTRVTRRGNGQLWARVYRYSPEGDLLTVEDTVRGATRYGHDAAHRLIGLLRPDGTDEPVELDAAGNILRMPGLGGVTLAEGNRLQSANGDKFEYDRRNNISARTGSAGTTRYHYDSRDMLVRIERSGQTDWTAGYDPLGRRVWTASGTREVQYFWDTDRLAAERDESGRVRVYIYADHFAMVPLMFVDYPSASAEPADGRCYYVHTDQIGTPILVEDATGQAVWSARIEPYGLAVIDSQSTISFNIRFPGHYHDAETGLHYNRFRSYSPELGRYLQSDPIGLAGGFNLYAYCRSNPLVHADVRGLAEGGEGGCDKHKDNPQDDCADCQNQERVETILVDGVEVRVVKTTNSAGDEVERRYVQNHDDLLAVAMAHADGGSLDNMRNTKPNWWESHDGMREIEWNPDGHANTNEGPHVTVRERDPGDPRSRQRAVAKYFIEGQDDYQG